MARYIAIEWNENEARLAVAGGRPGQAVFEQAFTVSLQSPDPTEGVSPPDPGERIAAALAARGIGKLPTLIALGRGKLELRQLSLPPSPDEELPDLVRFQAMREFGSMQSDWPLDFVPLDTDPEQPRAVLAAAVAPEQMSEIDALCHKAGLKPSRVLLRPCSAASLFSRAHPAEQPGQVRLIIDLLGDEADLTVVRDQTVVFLRSARLSGNALESIDAAEVLESEIRRTLAAAQNLLKGQKVDSLLLFGTSLKHNGLRDTLHKRFKLPVDVFDPFEGLKLKGDLRRSVPPDSDRFAPLLGALLDEIQGDKPAFDFLHPRRPSEKSTQKNLVMGVGAAAAVLLCGLLLFNFVQKQTLQSDIRKLNSELTTLKKQVNKAQKTIKDAKTVQDWAANNIHWLDELRWVSERTPPAEDVVFTQMSLTASNKTGQVTLKGVVKDLEAYSSMERNLNDEKREVKSGAASRDDSLKGYSQKFDSSIFIATEKD
jgi:Tfp pilus assembly PilM family ATPase/Tfp pilus assembly protein PilN